MVGASAPGCGQISRPDMELCMTPHDLTGSTPVTPDPQQDVSISFDKGNPISSFMTCLKAQQWYLWNGHYKDLAIGKAPLPAKEEVLFD